MDVAIQGKDEDRLRAACCWWYQPRAAGNIEKQARQYTYILILNSVRVDTFAMEKYLSIKYFELVCLYPWILSATYFIAICGLSGCIVSKRYDFRKKKKYGTRNVCFDFLYNFCVKHFSLPAAFSQTLPLTVRTSIYITCHSFQIVTNLEYSRQIFQRIHESYISRKSVQWKTSWCMRTGGQTDRHDEPNSYKI